MKLFYTLFLTLYSSFLFSQERYFLNSEQSSVTYFARHPAHKWEGKNSKLQGVLEWANANPSRIAVKANLADFDSGNVNRDSNGLRVLRAISYPEVRFYSESLTLGVDGKIVLEGYFDLAGIQQPASVELEYDNTENSFILEGSHLLDLNAFKLELPRFLLRPIDSEIRIELKLVFSLRSS